MNIKLLYQRYNWESYSVVRLLVEEFERQANITTSYNADFIISLGQNEIYSVHNYKISKQRSRVVQVGLSDPNCHNAHDAQYADYVFTNDKRMSDENFYSWLPCFTSQEYFYPIPGISKETDILFIGLCNHPFINGRLNVVEKLRQRGIRVKVFGTGWPEHDDNFDFISGVTLIEEINKAKLCLDLCNSTSSLGSRIFQAAACAVPVLTKDRKDTWKLFGDSVLYYDSMQDMHSTILYHLSHSEKLYKLGAQSMATCLAKHQVKHRVQQILQEIHYETN